MLIFPHFNAQVKRNIPLKNTQKTHQNTTKIPINPIKTILYVSILYQNTLIINQNNQNTIIAILFKPICTNA